MQVDGNRTGFEVCEDPICLGNQCGKSCAQKNDGILSSTGLRTGRTKELQNQPVYERHYAQAFRRATILGSGRPVSELSHLDANCPPHQLCAFKRRAV
jgi:hypothetical protein